MTEKNRESEELNPQPYRVVGVWKADHFDNGGEAHGQGNNCTGGNSTPRMKVVADFGTGLPLKARKKLKSKLWSKHTRSIRSVVELVTICQLYKARAKRCNNIYTTVFNTDGPSKTSVR